MAKMNFFFFGLFLFFAPQMLSAQTAGSVSSATDIKDRIIFKNGTQLSGQIVEGTKTLIDDPNRYEIILDSGLTVSVEDSGQIESVIMDGQTLTDPLNRGGRGKLLEIIRRLRAKEQEELTQQAMKEGIIVVEWMVGAPTRKKADSEVEDPITIGSRLSVGDTLTANASSRLKILISGKLQVGLEEGTALQILKILVDPGTGLLTMDFDLSAGIAWLNIPENIQDKKGMLIQNKGLRFQISDGRFRLEQKSNGDLVLAYFLGSDMEIRRMFDGRTMKVLPEFKYLFSSAMLQGTAGFTPDKSLLKEGDEWQIFDEWTPFNYEIPIRFTLVGKPEMSPRPMVPFLGLPSEKYVFQDLQPIEITGLAPVLQSYRIALRKFEQSIGRLPTKEEGLAALRIKPEGIDNWSGPYIAENIPTEDPWNHPFKYSVITSGNRQLIDLYSTGENGIDEQGLGDDLR